MPASSDEELATFCENVWQQVAGLDPGDILAVLLAVTGEVIAAADTPEPCLDHCCDMLAAFVHRFDEPPKPRLRLVPKEPA